MRLGAVRADAAAAGPVLVAIVEDSRGWITGQSGRLSEGLRILDDAAQRHREAGLPLGEHYLEHCDALLDMRLLPEAMRMATLARDEFAGYGVNLLAAEAQVRVARLAGQLGDHAAAQRLCRDGPALLRLKGHLAGALRAGATGERRRLLAHARAGLRDLAEHRAALSSTELRALLEKGAPGEVLQGRERTRGAALLVTETPQVDGAEALLGELRSVQEELAAARVESGREPAEIVAQLRAGGGTDPPRDVDRPGPSGRVPGAGPA